MKAIFETAKKINLIPFDNNEEILLSSFNDFANSNIKFVHDEIPYVCVEEAKAIIVNDDLSDINIYTNFPTAIDGEIESHDIIKFKGGSIIKCIKSEEDISIYITSDDFSDILLYSITLAGTVQTNMKVLNITLPTNMVVQKIYEDSIFYECFTI